MYEVGAEVPAQKMGTGCVGRNAWGVRPLWNGTTTTAAEENTATTDMHCARASEAAEHTEAEAGV